MLWRCVPRLEQNRTRWHSTCGTKGELTKQIGVQRHRIHGAVCSLLQGSQLGTSSVHKARFSKEINNSRL